MFSKTHLAEHRLVYTAAIDAIDALGDTGDDAIEFEKMLDVLVPF